ncbi:MAG: hypothetical protein ACI97A_004199 [Planctomycetota bacterium]|jgi:hypothetical protein
MRKPILLLLLALVSSAGVAAGQLNFATYLDRSSPDGFWAGPYNFNNDGVGDQAFSDLLFQPKMRLGPHGAEQPILTFTIPSNEIYLFLDDDGDGDTDVILIRDPNSTPTNGVKRIECNGDGTFGPVTSLGFEGSQVLKFLKFDADGDGDLDVLVVRDTVNPSARWYLSDPAGTIRTGVTALPSNNILVEDFDGDGWAEIICGYTLGVFNFEWNGSSFVQQQFIAGPNIFPTIAWDYDRDGLRDLLAGNRVYKNLGASGLAADAIDIGSPADSKAVRFDLNNDGFDELIWNVQDNHAPGRVSLRYFSASSSQDLIDGTARIPVHGQLSIDEEIPPTDVNGDGKLDFFFEDRILLGADSLPERDLPRTSTPIHVFDVDDDGDLDYLDDRGYIMKNVGGAEFEFGPLISDTFNAEYPTPLPGFLGFPGDFDGDGVVDVIRTDLYNIKRDMVFRRGMSKGKFDETELVSIAFANNSLGADPANFSVLNREGFAVDLDNDGDTDLATPNYLYLNDGTGFLTEIAGPMNGLSPSGFGDVDDDGETDLLCSGNKEGGNYVVVLRKQAGTISYLTEVLFGAPSTNPTDWTLSRPTFDDLDDDGDLDVLVLNKSSFPNLAELLIWENTGPTAGGFILRSSALAPLADFMAARITPQVADFDFDGFKDVRVGPLSFSGSQANALGGFLFIPAVQFQLGQDIPTTSFDRLIDLDGDGDLDLLGDTVIANQAITRLGTGFAQEYGQSTLGTGGFAPVLSAQGPFAMATGDSRVRISRGLGQAQGIFSIGNRRVQIRNFYGLNLGLHVDSVFSSSPTTLFGASMEPGVGFRNIEFTISPFLAGRTFYMQAGFSDPGAALGFTATNGLQIQFGQ